MKRLSLQPGAAPRGEGEQIAILKAVLPYLWPAGRFDLKLRVVLALLCLVLAKVITVLTPFAYKYAVDALTGRAAEGQRAGSRRAPHCGTHSHGRCLWRRPHHDGGVRAAARRAVCQRRPACRAPARLKTFRHLHALSLRFHLERRTGGLSRIIERGTKGIETIVRFTLLNTFPTMLEIRPHRGDLLRGPSAGSMRW